MWHWWCLSWLKMIVLLNNKREEIDRAVFYCVSQNVNLVEIKHFSYWQKSDTVSTLRQSPCSSLVTFVPCPRKRVFVASSAFLVKNCFVILSSNFIYFTRPSNSSDSVISLTDSLWQNSSCINQHFSPNHRQTLFLFATFCFLIHLTRVRIQMQQLVA